MKHVLLGAALLLSKTALAGAPGGPPPGFWGNAPLPNAATRYDTFCVPGTNKCVERQVLEWGQVCTSGSDNDHVAEPVPAGFHYKSWRCVTDNPDDSPPSGKSGE